MSIKKIVLMVTIVLITGLVVACSHEPNNEFQGRVWKDISHGISNQNTDDYFYFWDKDTDDLYTAKRSNGKITSKKESAETFFTGKQIAVAGNMAVISYKDGETLIKIELVAVPSPSPEAIKLGVKMNSVIAYNNENYLCLGGTFL